MISDDDVGAGADEAHENLVDDPVFVDGFAPAGRYLYTAAESAVRAYDLMQDSASYSPIATWQASTGGDFAHQIFMEVEKYDWRHSQGD